MALGVVSVSKSFGSKRALVDISFEVRDRETVALLGPSGCGKSTVLGVIAGLIPPDQGEITWDGEPVSDIPPFRRDFGLMFQDFALFPHLDVADNIAFGLKMDRWSQEDMNRRVGEMLSLVQLEGFEKRDVNTLSGGEQQRVALARSLAPGPRLLMLDEPLGALDRTLRERLILDIRRILHELGQTAIYVTHDQEEAFTLADRVILMNAGRIEQAGTPQEIYRRPASLFVARFLGLANLIEGKLLPSKDGLSRFESPLGEFPVPVSGEGEAVLLIRPDAMRIASDGSASSDFDVNLPGTLREVTFRGAVSRVVVKIQGVRLVFEVPSRVDLPPVGDPVVLSLDSRDAFQVFQGNTNLNELNYSHQAG